MQLGVLTEPKIDQSGPPPAGEFTYVDISSVDNSAKRIVEPKRLPADRAPSRARQRLRRGDVLIAMTRPNLNAVALVPPELDGAICSTGFHVLRARDGVLPQWLYYGVQTRQFVGAMSDLVQGALYPAVRPKDIRAFDMPLPLLEEQRRVVAEIEKQFSRLDEAVAYLKRVITRLTLYRERVLADAFASEPNATLGELISVGPQNGLYLPKDAYGSGTPIVRIDDYQTDWIRPVAELRRVRAAESQASTWALQPGDLLVNRVNSMSHLGKCIVVPAALDGALFESNMMRFRLASGVLPRYVELYLGSRVGKRRLTANAKWAVNQASINQKDLQATEISVPSLEHQARTVAEVDRRLAIGREVQAAVDAKLRSAGALRQSVLMRVYQTSPATGPGQ